MRYTTKTRKSRSLATALRERAKEARYEMYKADTGPGMGNEAVREARRQRMGLQSKDGMGNREARRQRMGLGLEEAKQAVSEDLGLE